MSHCYSEAKQQFARHKVGASHIRQVSPIESWKRARSARLKVGEQATSRDLFAPVSTPLACSELRLTLDPADFNLGNLAGRMKKADPWADFFQSGLSLARKLERVRNL